MISFRAKIREAIDYGDIDNLNELLTQETNQDLVLVALNQLTPSGLTALMWTLFPKSGEVNVEMFEYLLFLVDDQKRALIDSQARYQGLTISELVDSRHDRQIREQLQTLLQRYQAKDCGYALWQQAQAKIDKQDPFTEENHYCKSLMKEGSDLRGVDLRGMDLREGHFVLCDLTNADFRGAALDNIDLSDSTLTDLRIDVPGLLSLEAHDNSDALINVLQNAHINFDLNGQVGQGMLWRAITAADNAKTLALYERLSSMVVNTAHPRNGNSLLHEALAMGNSELALRIVDEHHEQLQVSNNFGESAWAYAARRFGNKQAVRDALAQLFRQEFSSYDGDILLQPERVCHAAAEAHDAQTIKMLVALHPQGDWINHADLALHTALHQAVLYRDAESVQALLQHPQCNSACLDADLQTPLVIAVQEGARECVQQLLAVMPLAALLQRDGRGNMAIHYALLYDHFGILQLFLDKYADQARQFITADKRNLYHLACRHGKVEMLHLLHQYHLQDRQEQHLVLDRDVMGQTPLHLAIKHGNIKTVIAMFDHPLTRYSMQVADNRGKSADELLKQSRFYQQVRQNVIMRGRKKFHS